MKTIRTIHTALILMVLAFLSACSTDSADPIQGDNGGDNPGDKVTVHMTLSTAPSSGTRATLSWNDGVDAENMKSWVVAFVKDGKVVSFAENTDVSADKRIKDDVIIKNLVKGETYQVYSFANLTAAELDIAKDAPVDFDCKNWKMNGNGFDVNAADCKGIPMSNKQEVTVDATGNPTQKELWVVRMLAKVTLKFKNPSATDLVINDITISDITKNSKDNADAYNIMLLPKHSDADNEHVTCTPNLVGQAATDNYRYTLSSPKTIKAGTDYKAENEISFYVNESAAGNTSKYFIGLYPSIRDNGTTLSYTCYYPEEEFHIQPKVVKASNDSEVTGINNTEVKWELIKEDGMADETTNAKLVFKTLPSWNTTTGYFEGIFNDDKADKQSAIYKVTVPVPGASGKELIYKILFTKDLRSYAARKYTRQSYYFRTKQ